MPYNGTDTTGGDSSMSIPSSYLLIPTSRTRYNMMDINELLAK